VNVPRVVIESGRLRGRVVSLPPGKRYSFGRDADCSFVLPDEHVSRLHFVLVLDAGRYHLADRGRNGTFLNGRRVEKEPLRSGDLIRAGQTFISFFDDDEDPLVGKVVAGYRIEHRLGRGGMGTVYRATQISLDRAVALKVLSPSLTKDREFVRRFVQEAQSAGKLNHPNVVQVHDVGHAGEVYFLSMEFMEGGSLQERVEREGKLAPALVVPWAVDALSALVWAEGEGIVHRDIKPDNLLLDGRGIVKIADFGIAADLRRSKTAVDSEKIVGTPRYMAPEQALGKKVDHRADLYSLGSTLYTLLSGSPPFDGETPVEVLLKKVKSLPRPLREVAPELPESLAGAVEKLMARRPEERFQRADDAQTAFRDLVPEAASETALARGGGAAAAAFRTRRGRLAVASAAGVLCGLVIAIVVVLTRGGAPVETAASDPALRPAVVESALPTLQDPSSEPSPAPTEVGATASAEAPEAPFADSATPAPSEPTPDLSPDHNRLRLELLAIREESKSLDEATRRLAEFERSHPSGEWKAPVENVRRYVLREIEDGQRELQELSQKSLGALIDLKRFREADEAISSFQKRRRLLTLEAEEERRRVGAAASEALRDAITTAERRTQEGEHEAARQSLVALVASLPLSHQGEAMAALEALKLEQQKIEGAAAALEAAERKLVAALGKADLAAADAVLSRLSGLPPGKLAARVQELAREVGVFREVLGRLRARADAKSELNLGSAQRPRRVRVVELTGVDLSVAQGTAAPERLNISDLSNDVLAALVEGAAGAKRPPDLNAELREKTGIFLLYACGAERAWEWLGNAGLDDAAEKLYRSRLQPAIEEKWNYEAAEILSRIESSPPREPLDSAVYARALDRLRALVRAAKDFGAKTALRATLAAVFLETQRRALRAAGPKSFFSTEDIEVNSQNGDFQATYDFKEDGDLRDFTPVGEGTSELRLAAKGVAFVRGEVRFLRQNPLRGHLRVRGAVQRSSGRVTADFSVAFWTRGGDRLSAVPLDSSVGGTGGMSVLVFALGATWLKSSSTINGVRILESPRGEVLLPADVLLRLPRSQREFTLVQPARCDWGSRATRPYGTAFAFDAAADSKGMAHWRVGRQELVSNLVVSLDEAERSGSVTFFAPGEGVGITSLQVEAQLDPWWVEDEIERRAAAALREIDPEATPAAGAWMAERSREEQRRRLGRGGKVVFADDFAGERQASWEVRNEDRSHYSVDKTTGTLTIRTQKGAFVGAALGGKADYKNLFLVPRPTASDEDFEVTAHLVGFHPQEPVQQAGIVVWDDEDNYIKATLEWARDGRRVILLREVNASVYYRETKPLPRSERVWLRLRKCGTVYSLWWSKDGWTFTRVSDLAFGDGRPKHLGLVAKNSSTEAQETDAPFDFFEVRTRPAQP
jgi:regulation of enolase protein 1 (concanavalin A-like superfamily)